MIEVKNARLLSLGLWIALINAKRERERESALCMSKEGTQCNEKTINKQIKTKNVTFHSLKSGKTKSNKEEMTRKRQGEKDLWKLLARLRRRQRDRESLRSEGETSYFTDKGQ